MSYRICISCCWCSQADCFAQFCSALTDHHYWPEVATPTSTYRAEPTLNFYAFRLIIDIRVTPFSSYLTKNSEKEEWGWPLDHSLVQFSFKLNQSTFKNTLKSTKDEMLKLREFSFYSPWSYAEKCFSVCFQSVSAFSFYICLGVFKNRLLQS